MIRPGEEVINGLDEFVVLPERTLNLVRFVPEFVREGGPSFKAEDPLTRWVLGVSRGTAQVPLAIKDTRWPRLSPLRRMWPGSGSMAGTPSM